MLHEVFGEKANPGVIAVEDDPLPRRLGLPNEVVLQQRGRIQIHYHINESWDAASGDGLGTDGLVFLVFLSLYFEQRSAQQEWCCTLLGVSESWRNSFR